jgi:hypothetical protein
VDTIVRDGLLSGKQQVQPQPCEPSTESIEDHSPPLQQHIQFVQITKEAEEHGEYLFKNQSSEEPPYSKVNSRTSFVLVGVTDVGQESHLVPEGLLLPRGLVLLLGLPTNGLMQEQSYRWWKYKRKRYRTLPAGRRKARNDRRDFQYRRELINWSMSCRDEN